MFRAAVLLLLILLVAINARMILESVLAAKGIDEEIVAKPTQDSKKISYKKHGINWKKKALKI